MILFRWYVNSTGNLKRFYSRAVKFGLLYGSTVYIVLSEVVGLAFVPKDLDGLLRVACGVAGSLHNLGRHKNGSDKILGTCNGPSLCTCTCNLS